MYLIQNKSGYYFRLTIPSDLQSQIGIKELRRSLKGETHRTASQLSILIAGRLHQLFRKIRGTRMGLTPNQIKQMINGFIHECLNYEEDSRTSHEPVYPDIPEEHLVIIDDFTEDAQQELKSGDYSNIERVVDHILEVNNCQIPKDSLDYKKMCRETLKAQITVLAIEKRRNEGDYSDDDKLPPLPDITTLPQPIPPSPASPLLKNLIDEWVSENTMADNWKPRSLTSYEGHLRVILQILGDDTQIGTIDHPTVKAIKDTLLKLPTGMNKKKIFENKSVTEIIRINEDQKLQTLSAASVNGYLTTLGALFKWCVGNGHLYTNYADGKKIKIKKKRVDEIRDIFATDDLNMMFQSPGYLEDTFDEPYKFWLPILGLYTGARLNEICQLRLDDIQTVDGIYTFILQEDEEDKKISVKGYSGHRTVPIHPFVADDLNLKGYVELLKTKGETRLFPELPFQNDNYGHKASKWFRKFRHGCGIDSPKQVYHCFRHTLSDNLKQQLVTGTVIDELTGHALQGESMSRYGKKYMVDVLYKEAVLKLAYGINLNHLKRSQYTGMCSKEK